jgi:hypothetical protein
VTNVPDFEAHGEFVPDREILVHHQPWMERMVLYNRLGHFKDGCGLFTTRGGVETPTELMAVAPGNEPPIYLIIGREEADAIANAISPRPQATERHLDDAINVRDRLLHM